MKAVLQAQKQADGKRDFVVQSVNQIGGFAHFPELLQPLSADS